MESYNYFLKNINTSSFQKKAKKKAPRGQRFTAKLLLFVIIFRVFRIDLQS